MGPPCAGKGTQAQRLADEIGYERFSTGDAFRVVSRQDTDIGRQVKDTIDNGKLCPPELAAQVVIDAVHEKVHGAHGIIFDGTPRTLRESEIVDEFFSSHGLGRPYVIFLNVAKNHISDRAVKRMFCLDIKGDFPIATSQDKERCRSLGGRVGVRPDDEVDKFETRWNEYLNQTYPVVEKYLLEGIVHEIDGTAPMDVVHREIMATFRAGPVSA